MQKVNKITRIESAVDFQSEATTGTKATSTVELKSINPFKRSKNLKIDNGPKKELQIC